MDMLRAITIAVLYVTVLSSPPCQGALQVGTAMKVITPDPLLPISGGMGPTEPATKKHGELTVRAIVVDSGEVVMGIVSIDALGFPAALGDRVRAQIKEIPGNHLMIGATHTHSAPDFYAFPDGQGGHTGDLKYIDHVCQQMVAVIREAYTARRPSRLRANSGVVEGKIAFNYYAPDLYDRRAGVVQFIGQDDRAIATLVNYAVHPEVLGPSQGIVSPDMIGPLCERIEQRVGGLAMFMNGAQGGMVTADNRDLDHIRDPLRGYWEGIGTWAECQRIGHLLADESLRLLEQSAPIEDPALSILARKVRFPVESDALWAVVKHSPLNYPHRDEDRSVSTTLNLVTLGNVQIATIPGEALPNIGFYLKRKMSGEHNLLFGLTNDAFGYILTEVDFASFPRYDYISRVSMGEQTGTILMKNLLEMVEEARSK